MMQELGHDIGMGTKSGFGYRVDIVVRKLCLPLLGEIPWHMVSGEQIRQISADETT